MKSPIFIFSLPRSGSTLLQRILMGHKDIVSLAEPWLLLPLCYMIKREGNLSEYSHITSYTGLQDFIKNLPNGEEDYYDALSDFAKTLYEKQCDNEKYFLDKTPRNYNIIPQIEKLFPSAKFIFLFRNPVHVYSSIIDTWSNGTLKNIFVYDRDLQYGPYALSDGYRLLKHKSYAVNYEKFVTNPEKYTIEICNYLDIPFDKVMLSDFINQDTKGEKGDPIGNKIYKCISGEPLIKWKKTFSTKFRKKILHKYINNLDSNLFDTQQYNKQEILKEIINLKASNRNFIKDRLDYAFSQFVLKYKVNLFFGKTTKKWTKNQYLS